MKVIFFTPEYPPLCGGVGYYVYYLARELKNAGIEPIIVIRGKKNRQAVEERISIYEIACPGVAPLNYWYVKKKLRKLILSLNGDILHIHTSTMPWVDTHMPTIATSHFCVAEGLPRYHANLHDIYLLYRKLLFPIYVKLERDLVKKCDIVTVVSNSMKQDFLKFHGINSEVVWNAVDVDKFHSNKVPKNSILFVGTLTAGKGIQDLLEASRLMAGPFPKVTVTIVGSGPMQRYLVRRVGRERLQNVRVIGRVSHEQLVRYYQESLCVVLPSYHEGLPTSVLEAMACGVPVVGTTVRGITELVEDGVDGLLVPPGRPELLAEKICYLLENSSLREEMGNQGRRKVEQEFTWDKVAARFKNMYDRLANQPPP